MNNNNDDATGIASAIQLIKIRKTKTSTKAKLKEIDGMSVPSISNNNDDDKEDTLEELQRKLGEVNKEIATTNPIYDQTELGNAKLLVNIMKDKFKWIPELDKWFYWDDTKWVLDEEFKAEQCVHKMLDKLKLAQDPLHTRLVELNQTTEVKDKDSSEAIEANEIRDNLKALKSWYLKSQSHASIQGSRKLCREQPHISDSYSKFDTKGHFFGVKNGIVNLKDGSIVTHNPKYLVTKSSTVEYNPTVDCPNWLEQLDTYMMGDKDKIRFLQVLLGSGMVGAKNKYFTLFHGAEGGNGKSTIVDTVDRVLGDYSMVGNSKLLTNSGHNSTEEYDLANMKGSRFVIFNETKKSDATQLSDDIIKKVTDSGDINARHPYGKPFQYKPVFTPIFCVNHLPTASGDPALWRRLVIMEWNYIIPKRKQNANFIDDVFIPEASGILNWLVEGAQMFLQNGLMIPDCIKQETSNAKDDSDNVLHFLEQEYDVDDSDRVGIKLTDMLDEYNIWCDTHKFKGIPNSRTFKRDLQDRKAMVKVGYGNAQYVYGFNKRNSNVNKIKNQIGNKRVIVYK